MAEIQSIMNENEEMSTKIEEMSTKIAEMTQELHDTEAKCADTEGNLRGTIEDQKEKMRRLDERIESIRVMRKSQRRGSITVCNSTE